MSNKVHHANLLVGRKDAAEAHLYSLCQSWGMSLANNPDFVVMRSDSFGIEEARQLKALSLRKALGERQVFFVLADTLTLEAQNALLKTLEDPTPLTHFFISVRDESILIPTLISRVEITRIDSGEVEDMDDAKKFLSLVLKDRLTFAKKFVDDEKNLTAFLDDLLVLVRKNGTRELLAKIYKVRRLIYDTVPAPRLVIEHLALVL